MKHQQQIKIRRPSRGISAAPRRSSTPGPCSLDLSSGGFTLIEVLIALAITVLCLGILVASYGAVVRGHTRAQDNLELTQSMNETLERIHLLLQSAYLSPFPAGQILTRFETMNEEKMSAPYQALTFTTLAHTSHRTNAKEADLAEVTLFTKEEPPLAAPEGEITLRRLRVRVGGEINSRFEVEGGLVYTLAEHVTTFKLDYLTPEGEWKEEWRPEDRQNTLPCAVRVTLGLRGTESGELVASLIIPLEMFKKCQFDNEKIFERESIK